MNYYAYCRPHSDVNSKMTTNDGAGTHAKALRRVSDDNDSSIPIPPQSRARGRRKKLQKVAARKPACFFLSQARGASHGYIGQGRKGIVSGYSTCTHLYAGLTIVLYLSIRLLNAFERRLSYFTDALPGVVPRKDAKY